jgi:hypothetical protein
VLNPGVGDFWHAIRLGFDDGLAVFGLDYYGACFLINLANKPPVDVANFQHFRFSFLRGTSLPSFNNGEMQPF